MSWGAYQLDLPGHNDEYGNTTFFARQLYSYVDDVIPNCAFHGKKSLRHFVFPEVVKEIGFNSFRETSLSGALIIPDDVKIIWASAFYATNIISVTLAPNLEIIGSSVFSDCTA